MDAAQLRLVRLLAAPDDNLVVVGEDDQPYVPRNSHPQGSVFVAPRAAKARAGSFRFLTLGRRVQLTYMPQTLAQRR